MSTPEPEWHIAKKSTWNINALTKVERMRIYDALAQCSTKKEREAVLRRTIHFPYSMFSDLMKSVNDVFEKNECPPANHKNECYKELKHALNDFQQDLNDKRIISDSGKPVRFTLKRRSPVTTTTPKPTTPKPTTPKPTTPKTTPKTTPLPIGRDTDMRDINDLKLRMFATMISDRTTEAEKRRFIEKYVRVTDENGEPFIGSLNDIIADILEISNDDDHLNTESKIKGIFEHLLHLKNETYPELIYVLYPFPAVHPNIFRNKRRIPTVRLLGGGGKRRIQRRTARKLR